MSVAALRESPAWDALRQHYHVMKGLHLRQLFGGDPLHGRDENLAAGRRALYGRARCNSAVSLGTCTNEMEDGPLEAGGAPHRLGWRDD
jgi:hypothetical protein